MLRLVCQTLSTIILVCVALAGCVALAQGPSGGSDAAADEGLRDLLWRLGGWVESSGRVEGDLHERKVSAGAQELSLLYSDTLASWPVALKAACRPAEGGEPLTVSDARPFGADNVRGAEPDKLAPCLYSILAALEAGDWIDEPLFEELEPGLWLAVTRARYGPRLGSRDVVIVKADPARFRLAPYHEAEREGWASRPVSAIGWAERLPDAALVLNAGQYYPDRTHMGTLKRDGRALPGPTHEQWKGYAVQGPAEGSAEGRAGSGFDIIDEDTRRPEGPGPEAFATVLQSHMVLDRLGRVRVRDSDRLASRSALAIDRTGSPWLVTFPGAVSLYDLALLLGRLELVAAVGLDGGLETQVALRSPGRSEDWLGSASNNFLGNLLVGDFTPSLPAVLALERIKSPAGPSAPPQAGATTPGDSPGTGATRPEGPPTIGAPEAAGRLESGATRPEGPPESGATTLERSPDSGATSPAPAPETGTPPPTGTPETGAATPEGPPATGVPTPAAPPRTGAPPPGGL